MSEPDREETVENVAASIEDLLRMGIIKFDDSNSVRHEKVILTAKFSFILSKMMADPNLMNDDQQAQLRALYYAFLIYLDDELKLPRKLTMAIANDIEKFQDASELSKYVRRYVMVLYNILREA
jgi:chromosome condensin MukBEF MukE localization factor